VPDAAANRTFGDIIKVPPTSKGAGDMAMLLVGTNVTPADVVNGPRGLSFPESVVEFFEGRLGDPPGGFPEKLRQRVLRGRKPITDRPGLHLPPVDLDDVRKELTVRFQQPMGEQDVLAYLMYPRVFPDLVEHQRKDSDTSLLPTSAFFYGMERGEELGAEIEPGKPLIIKFQAVGEPHPDGKRTVFFELNGQPREVLILDKALVGKEAAGARKAE